MTRKDLTEKLSKEFGLTKKRSDEIVMFIFDQIAEELLLGGKVIIQSFGTFYWELAKEREVVHPRTKERIRIPQRYKLKFEPARALKVRKREISRISSTYSPILAFSPLQSVRILGNEKGKILGRYGGVPLVCP